MLGPAARWLLAAVSAATVLLTGCTSGSSDPKPTSVATTTSAASSPSSRSPTPTPPATKVPVDQIPPGNPASWVPAGVPTAAKYKEPGDVVPMFTRAMFQRTDTGALAMAGYYIQAQNWALAVNSPAPYKIICTADACARTTRFLQAKTALGQHVVGQRISATPPSVRRAPSLNNADYIVRLDITTGVGKLVDGAGKTVEMYSKFRTPTNLYLKWSGKVWRVTGDFLVQ